MTIKDLKNMMIVEIRNNERYLVVDGMLLSKFGYNVLKNYNDDLVIEDDDEHKFDIMAVYTTKEWGAGLNQILYNRSLDLVWKREEDLLTSNEREYLKALIAPVTQPIKHIIKEFSYIRIILKDGDIMCLCEFNNMLLKFSNLEQGKLYTPKDLGVED